MNSIQIFFNCKVSNCLHTMPITQRLLFFHCSSKACYCYIFFPYSNSIGLILGLNCLEHQRCCVESGRESDLGKISVP